MAPLPRVCNACLKIALSTRFPFVAIIAKKNTTPCPVGTKYPPLSTPSENKRTDSRPAVLLRLTCYFVPLCVFVPSWQKIVKNSFNTLSRRDYISIETLSHTTLKSRRDEISSSAGARLHHVPFIFLSACYLCI